MTLKTWKYHGKYWRSNHKSSYLPIVFPCKKLGISVFQSSTGKCCSMHYAVNNCIPSPHYLGISRDLAGTNPGISRILCPRRPGTYPGLMRGDISLKRAWNLLPRDVRICQDSDQRCPELWGWDLPRDLQERQYHGLYLGHHKVQNWIPAIPG